MGPIDYLKSAFSGTKRARREHSQALAARASIRTGLAQLHRLCPTDEHDGQDTPIFLLSAGWRSGSTLLQRLIMSDPQVILWGEPYDECGTVQAMAATVKAFREGWPPQAYYYSGERPEADDWIANFFPEPAWLRRAHRAFLDTALAQPARQAGARRWGIKEVRLNIEHAHYLRWLYPNARFVFLYRNPLKAYQSYCRFGRNWYDTWPEQPVFTPTAFGKHWRDLTQGFLLGAGQLGAVVVRYEDLVEKSSELLDRLEQHLGLKLDRTVLDQKVGTSERGGERAWVSRMEKLLLRRAVSPTAEELGYVW
jgi:hypothetical protein